jgi:hypothetical protein
MSMFENVEGDNTNSTQLAILPTKIAFTKDSIADAVENLVQQIEDSGDDDVLDVYSKCTALVDYLNNVKKGIQPMVEDEVAKYEKGEVAQSNGIKIVMSSSAAKYSFESYEGWVKQKAISDRELDELKRIEGMMKKAEGTAGIIDEETGEIVPPRVKVKEGATTIRATIPKS